MSVKKSKISAKSYMKRSLAVFLILPMLFAYIVPTLIGSQVLAQGETYLLYYPDDKATKASLKEAYDQSGSDKFNNPAMENVSILASGGTMFGDKPQRLVYDRDVNSQLNENGGGTKDADGSEQYFTRVYYCDLASGERTYSTPTGQGAYYRITYAVALTDMGDSGKLFDVKTHNQTSVGATKILKITPAKAGGVDKTETLKNLDNGAEANDLGKDIDKIDNAKCRPSPVGEDKVSVKNYYTAASAAEKESVKGVLAAAEAGGNGDGDRDKTQADCDVKLSSPLSWILCPVIDLGAGLTDFVFKEIVGPLLKDVPISTESNDPGFKAWQQFRLLGNILLVGSLLAIVYSQAKGSK